MADMPNVSPAPDSPLGTADAEVAAPFAAAMRAHVAENWPQLLGLQQLADGEMSWVTTADWFGQNAFRERNVDDLIATGIRGPVLDVGAGAGRLALKIQAAGIEVVALDCEAACIELLKAKGVHNVVHADIRNYETEKRFATIIFMDSTFGLIGDVDAAGPLLDKLKSLLLPDGVVLVQDVERSVPLLKLEWRFVFRDQVGPYFRWLNFSFAGLSDAVRPHGWRPRRMRLRGHPLYVAQLTPDDHLGARAWDFTQKHWFELALLVFVLWLLSRLF
jgi:SAM-dependent methyltransferase